MIEWLVTRWWVFKAHRRFLKRGSLTMIAPHESLYPCIHCGQNVAALTICGNCTKVHLHPCGCTTEIGEFPPDK